MPEIRTPLLIACQTALITLSMGCILFSASAAAQTETAGESGDDASVNCQDDQKTEGGCEDSSAIKKLGQRNLPTPVPGLNNRLPNIRSKVPAISKPNRPIDLKSSGTETDAEKPTVPSEYDTGLNNARVIPNLQSLPKSEARELRDQFEAARRAAATQPMVVEAFRSNATGPVRTINIIPPGGTQRQTVTYQEIDGYAVAEGDMILGKVADLSRWEQATEIETGGDPNVRRQGLNAIANTQMLWPNGRIPYVINSALNSTDVSDINTAVGRLNSQTNLTLVRRNGESDYVEYVRGNDPIACSSSVGRQGGRQVIRVSPNGCGVGTTIHETLHAAGIWHEQSRPDRDTFVRILSDNIPKDRDHNFEKKSLDEGLGVGVYNYQSIMHYSPFAFGISCTPNMIGGIPSDPNCGCGVDANGNRVCNARTIAPRQSGASIVRDTTLASDRDAINALYPSTVGPQQGLDWGNDYYATATAVGDVDGDGLDEVIIGRYANENSRFVVYDDAQRNHQILASGPSNWGANIEVTDIAVGDIDGDGRMEIGVTRRTNTNNRYFVYRFNGNGLTQVFQGGNDWGSGNYATSIAFGDVDGDGRDEIAVGRRADSSGRYYLFDDASASFNRLAIGGSQWGSGNYTTALAFGDVDGDGKEELGVARRASSGQRYEVVAYSGGQLRQRHAGGQDWGSGYYATSIAFGNVDGDRGAEMIVGRKADENSRFFVIDDRNSGFALLQSGGQIWGRGYHVTGVDMADVDNDNIDEIVVSRNAGENGRYFVFDDRARGFSPIPINSGAPLFSGVGATDISAGDMNGDGRADLAISYNQKVTSRMRWESIYMNPPGP
jgi:hypothetical protein